MRLPNARFPAALIGLALAALAPSAGGQAPDRRVIVAEQRKRMEAAFAAMPKLEQTKARDVFSLRMLNKGLACESPLLDKQPLRQGQMRAELAGIEGLTSVQVSRLVLGGRRGPTELRNFTLTVHDYSDPEVVSTVEVQSQPSYLHIERQSKLADGYQSIRLMQQGPGHPAGEAAAAAAGMHPPAGRVQFTVIHTTNGGQAPVTVNREAPDFYTLVRTYPEDIDRHLRPVFRQLGQEQVFSPDPLIAWQVFADQWRADERTGRRVRDLLPRLGDDDFRARDAASAQLERMGRDGAAVLLHIDRRALTPEQNMRLDRALGPYTQLPAREAQRLGGDVAFLLDCLYSDDAAVRRAAARRLGEVVDTSIDFDVDAPPAQRSEAVAALRKRYGKGKG